MATNVTKKVEADSVELEAMADRLWLLRFSLEAATRYHEARRARLESYVSLVKFLSIVGAVLTFVAISGWLPEFYGIKSEYVVVFASGLIAFINLLDLVFAIDGRARLHTDLYRRYKGLQERVARNQRKADKLIDGWEADAQAIRADEPALFYALYAEYWNLAVEKFEADRKYLRRVGRVRRFFRHYLHFNPLNFPARSL
jgi:hypothetical protein